MALGVVLYEMLKGKRAFAGEDVSDTLAYLLTKEPDWEALPPSLPRALRRVLERGRDLKLDPARTARPSAQVPRVADTPLHLVVSKTHGRGPIRHRHHHGAYRSG